MAIWTNEINELDTLYKSFKGHLPEIVKEMEQLIRTDDPNVVMLYSRRCLEVIITDLCECELKRPRKTEPLKGIIDKLNSEEKVPSYIIASMHSLNSMATFGAHPKDFDPEQVKPVLSNLAIIIKWYLRYKDFQVVSKTEVKEEEPKSDFQSIKTPEIVKPEKRKLHLALKILFGFVALFLIYLIINSIYINKAPDEINGDDQAIMEVKIGDQLWMTKNLKTTTLNDGTPISLVTDKKEWTNLGIPAYCWYNNNASKFSKSSFGALYNWSAVNTGKLCPTGWHVPTETEWRNLFSYVGGEDNAGDELKAIGKNFWNQRYNKATDHFGFSAVGGGYRYMSGTFNDLKKEGMWWTSTVNNEITSMTVSIFSGAVNVLTPSMNNEFGLSVRCIYDLTLLKDYDQNYYKAVKIGDQIWMAENLKTTRYNDGTPIFLEMRSADAEDLNTPSYCYYGNDDTYKATYGALYNWYAVNTGMLCPTGWHIPSDTEWTVLAEYLGGNEIAGGKLKEAGISHWIAPNSGANNESGFTAIPGGFGAGGFINFNYGSYFWSSTAIPDELIAWGRELYTYHTRFDRSVQHKAKGFSVRCVKD